MKQSRPLHRVFAHQGSASLDPGRAGLVIPGRGARASRGWGLRRLQAHDQLLPLLVAGTLLTTLTLVVIAYLTVRSDVLASQQQQVSRDAHIATAVLAGPGGPFALKNGQLAAVSASGEVALSSASAQLSHLRELTGERVAIYAVQARGLIAVAANGLGAAGQPADAAVAARLVGDCGPLAPSTCHRAYAGAIQMRDGRYTAAFVPIFDADGAFIGALGVAQPQSAVLAPAAQFTIVLLFVGLLVTLVVLAAGIWTCNVLAGTAFDALHLRLNHLATVSAELERAARQQVAAARRQERMARQITDGARDIDTMVNAMKQGHLSLHESATGVWSEMSQPGAEPDPTTAMRFARQAVVMAARVGVAAEDARTRCNHVVRLMNHVIAEGHVLAGHGYETERRAAELRGVIEQLERTLGEPLAASPSSPSRLTSLASLPDFAPREQGWLERTWRTVRNYAEQLARTIVTRARELVAELAGRISDGDEDLRAARPRRPSSATTRPPLGVDASAALSDDDFPTS